MAVNGLIFSIYRYYKTQTFDFAGIHDAAFGFFGVKTFVLNKQSPIFKLREKKFKTTSILRFMKETRRKYRKINC